MRPTGRATLAGQTALNPGEGSDAPNKGSGAGGDQGDSRDQGDSWDQAGPVSRSWWLILRVGLRVIVRSLQMVQ